MIASKQIQNMITYMKSELFSKSPVARNIKLLPETLVTGTQKLPNRVFHYRHFFFSEALFLVSFIGFCFSFLFTCFRSEHLLHFQWALTWTGITGKTAKEQRFWLSLLPVVWPWTNLLASASQFSHINEAVTLDAFWKYLLTL